MKDNEDEPEDVREATLVAEEIKKGEIDEYSGRPTQPHQTAKRRRHRCEQDSVKKKLKKKSEGECCRAREVKASRAPKTARAFVYQKECTLPKIKAIPRHCLTKQEWIDILATPSRKCPSPCLQNPITRRLRPVSARMTELAQPPKQRLVNTLQSRADILPTELVDKLIQNLERGTCLTPEQAENIFRDKDHRSKKKCPKNKKNVLKCPNGKYKDAEGGVPASLSPFDKDAANCQYLMAESFVRGILDWKCPIPRHEFKDITKVILKRLGFVLEYDPINGEDRKSQQMRFLAELVGSWVSGVLFEVAETRRTELEEECEKRRAEKAEESGETSDDDEDFSETNKEPDDEVKDVSKQDEEADGEEDDRLDEEGERNKDAGKDDGERRDDKEGNDDGDQDGKGGRRGQLAKHVVRDTTDKDDDDDDNEKFYDARTGTSQEIKEKKTPIKKTEMPKDSTDNELAMEKTREAEKIEDGAQEKWRERKADDRHPEQKDDPGRLQSEKRAAMETEEETSHTRDFDIEKRQKGESPREIDQKIPTKLKDSKEFAETEATEVTKNDAPERVTDAFETSVAMTEPKNPATDQTERTKGDGNVRESEKTVVGLKGSAGALTAELGNEELAKGRTGVSKAENIPAVSDGTPTKKEQTIGGAETTEIYAEATRMDQLSTEQEITTTLPEAKPEMTFDPTADNSSKQQARKTSIQEVEPTKINGEAKNMAVEPREAEEAANSSIPKPEVPFDTTIDLESKQEVRKTVEQEKITNMEAKAKKDEKFSEAKQGRRRITETNIVSLYPTDKLEKTIAKPETRQMGREGPSGTLIGTKYRTDTPFVTFDKIFHTIYNAIEKNKENKGNDPTTNRLHRAVFEKCSSIVQEDKPGPLSNLTKDILDVMSGKIAIWLRSVLTESQMHFVDKFPATVESTEVRDWTRWINLVTDTAEDWSKWIHNTIREAEDIGMRQVTKGDWANWTESVDSDAIKWRRFYLESVHQGHQNLTMIRDREVVKTGTRQLHDFNEDKYENEREVKITELEGERQKID